jgi:hypothetical protein
MAQAVDYDQLIAQARANVPGAGNAYNLINQNYIAQLQALQAQQAGAIAQKAERDRQYADAQKQYNRGIHSTYMDAINPYGVNAEQRGIAGTAISDYLKNAAYGTLLAGLGKSQAAYDENMRGSQGLWQQFLQDMGTKRVGYLGDRNTAVLAQQRYDAEQERQRQQEEEAKRRWELQWAAQQARDEEERRRWQMQWDYQLAQDAAAQAARYGRGYGGGGGGSTATGTATGSTAGTALNFGVGPLGYNAAIPGTAPVTRKTVKKQTKAPLNFGVGPLGYNAAARGTGNIWSINRGR